MEILTEMYLWTRVSPLNFESHFIREFLKELYQCGTWCTMPKAHHHRLSSSLSWAN